MSKYKDQDEELKKSDEYSKKLATHLYHMDAARIEEDINIFETPDTFRLTLERIPALSLFECKCGSVEEISNAIDIEWYKCKACGRTGQWHKNQ